MNTILSSSWHKEKLVCCQCTVLCNNSSTWGSEQKTPDSNDLFIIFIHHVTDSGIYLRDTLWELGQESRWRRLDAESTLWHRQRRQLNICTSLCLRNCCLVLISLNFWLEDSRWETEKWTQWTTNFHLIWSARTFSLYCIFLKNKQKKKVFFVIFFC